MRSRSPKRPPECPRFAATGVSTGGAAAAAAAAAPSSSAPNSVAAGDARATATDIEDDEVPVNSSNFAPTSESGTAAAAATASATSGDVIALPFTLALDSLVGARVANSAGIQQLLNQLSSVEQQLAEVRRQMAGAQLPLSDADAATMRGIHVNLGLVLNGARDRYTGLWEATGLAAHQVRCLFESHARWYRASIMLALLDRELNQIISGAINPAALVCLLVVEQPFPCSVKQNKVIEEPTKVELLTAARVTARAQSPVRAYATPADAPTAGAGQFLATGAAASKKGGTSTGARRQNKRSAPGASGAKSRGSGGSSSSAAAAAAAAAASAASSRGPAGGRVINGEVQLNNNRGLAVFDKLMFPSGSRLKPARLQFGVQVQLGGLCAGQSLYVQTDPTNEFIVKTNENQWDECEGLLLQRSAWTADNQEISWARFCNHLQYLYTVATHQSVQDTVWAQRPLTAADFEYLSRVRFRSAATVTAAQFAQFWLWFGPYLHRIRYQRHLSQLWNSGMLAGFVTRPDMERLLLATGVPGAFAIRFSERVAGQFAVSYLVDRPGGERVVKHYLIKDSDTAGAKKTLPDFLHQHGKEFKLMLRISYDVNSGARRLDLCQRDSVLSEMYSKKTDQSFQGYEDIISLQ